MNGEWFNKNLKLENAKLKVLRITLSILLVTNSREMRNRDYNAIIYSLARIILNKRKKKYSLFYIPCALKQKRCVCGAIFIYIFF